MKSFTKFYVLTLALLVSFSMMAQMTTEEVQYLNFKHEQEMKAHGPSLDVPYEPNNVVATGDDCSDPMDIGTFNSGDGANLANITDGTCGRVDDYDAAFGTCINPTYYANGEDMIMMFTVASEMGLEFNFDPVETYSSITVMDACPADYPNVTCIIGKAETANIFKKFQFETQP